jgi:acylphosphatase
MIFMDSSFALLSLVTSAVMLSSVTTVSGVPTDSTGSSNVDIQAGTVVVEVPMSLEEQVESKTDVEVEDGMKEEDMMVKDGIMEDDVVDLKKLLDSLSPEQVARLEELIHYTDSEDFHEHSEDEDSEMPKEHGQEDPIPIEEVEMMKSVVEEELEELGLKVEDLEELRELTEMLIDDKDREMVKKIQEMDEEELDEMIKKFEEEEVLEDDIVGMMKKMGDEEIQAIANMPEEEIEEYTKMIVEEELEKSRKRRHAHEKMEEKMENETTEEDEILMEEEETEENGKDEMMDKENGNEDKIMTKVEDQNTNAIEKSVLYPGQAALDGLNKLVNLLESRKKRSFWKDDDEEDDYYNDDVYEVVQKTTFYESPDHYHSHRRRREATGISLISSVVAAEKNKRKRSVLSNTDDDSEDDIQYKEPTYYDDDFEARRKRSSGDRMKTSSETQLMQDTSQPKNTIKSAKATSRAPTTKKVTSIGKAITKQSLNLPSNSKEVAATGYRRRRSDDKDDDDDFEYTEEIIAVEYPPGIVTNGSYTDAQFSSSRRRRHVGAVKLRQKLKDDVSMKLVLPKKSLHSVHSQSSPRQPVKHTTSHHSQPRLTKTSQHAQSGLTKTSHQSQPRLTKTAQPAQPGLSYPVEPSYSHDRKKRHLGLSWLWGGKDKKEEDGQIVSIQYAFPKKVHVYPQKVGSFHSDHQSSYSAPPHQHTYSAPETSYSAPVPEPTYSSPEFSYSAPVPEPTYSSSHSVSYSEPSPEPEPHHHH